MARVKIRPGLDTVNFFNDLGQLAGQVVLAASRNDLKYWADKDRFHTYVQGDEEGDFSWRVSHVTCETSQIIRRWDVDRPKISFVCNYCQKRWELHQLEAAPPKSFSDTFEYRVRPTGPWPEMIVEKSNGLAKYNKCESASNQQAAEFYAKGFDNYRKNGFRRNVQ